MNGLPLRTAGVLVMAIIGMAMASDASSAESPICVDCLRVRVGPPTVVRGPFPDEIDAAFSALRLPDGTFRGFSANGATYAVDGASLLDLGGPRRAVLEPGAAGSINDCGRWLTAAQRTEGAVLGFVHQERKCDYDQGQTDKSMALARSMDDGLSWTDLGTVITGTDTPRPGTVTGEGDCSLVDGHDGFLYAYCLRNSDWQTIAARAPVSDPTEWRKYHDGAWSTPGLGGDATAIGFVGTGAGYLEGPGWVAAVATDPWFGGLRLSLSADKASFVDLDEPLVPIDGADWERPADTDLLAYATFLNPENGSNTLGNSFLLAYLYVPAGLGFESRYLVLRDVNLAEEDAPLPVQAGVALTRWSDPAQGVYVTTTGPLTGDRAGYHEDAVVAHMLTRAPDSEASIGFVECAKDLGGRVDHILAEETQCAASGYTRERTAGWLFAREQPGSVPVYQCLSTRTRTHFVSIAADCEGLGVRNFLLGYGLEP